jgi:hypothetical protein
LNQGLQSELLSHLDNDAAIHAPMHVRPSSLTD